LNLFSSIGAFIIALSMFPFLVNCFMAFRRPKDQPNDPWEGNTLEWWTTFATPSTQL